MKRAIALVVVFVLLGGLILAVGYFHFTVKPEMIQGFMAASAPPPTTVAATPATVEQWQPQLRAVGSLAAVQGVDVAPEVGGIVIAVYFESGQEVSLGDPLFDLDDSTDQAELQSALASLRQVELELERQRTLLAARNTSQANYDRALADRDTADAAVQRAQAIIAQKAIVAPFNGQLGIRDLDLGEYVAAGTPVVWLQNFDPIYADFTVPEQAAPQVAVGQPIELGAEAYPDQVFAGVVQAVNVRMEQATRNVKVRAELANADHLLQPGMFVEVRVIVGTPHDVVTVPETAVTFSLYGDSVWVVVPAAAAGGAGEAPAAAEAAAAEAPAPEPEAATSAPEPEAAPSADAPPATAADDLQGRPMIVEQRFVTIGETRNGRVSITSGLEAGEVVVNEGQIKLYPGAGVVVDNSRALTPPDTLPRE